MTARRREMVTDAANYNTKHPDYGYLGESQRPFEGRNYGHLIWVGDH